MKSVVQSPEKVKNLLWFAVVVALAFWQIVIFDLAFYEPFVGHTSLVIPGQNGTRVADFVNFYNVASIAASSESHHVYDPVVQCVWMNKLIAPAHIDSVFYAPYTPLTIVLAIPLIWLAPQVAFLVWTLSGFTFGIAGSIQLLNQLQWSRRAQILFLLAVVSGSYSVLALALGQLAWWYVGLLAVYVLNLIRGKDVIAGIALSLMVVKPHYLLFFFMPALFFKRWRLLLTAIIAMLAAHLLVAHQIGWNSVFSYPSDVFAFETDPRYAAGRHPEAMVSLRAVFAQCLPPVPALKASIWFMALADILAAAMWWQIAKAKRIDGQASMWAMAMTVILALSFSPHSNTYDFLLLSVGAMLTLRESGKRLPEGGLSLKIWRVLLFTLPVMSWVFILPRVFGNYLRTPFFVVLMTLLFCGFMQLDKLLRQEESNSNLSQPGKEIVD